MIGLILLGAGCDLVALVDGEGPSSLVSDVQVLGVIATPPEIAPGETVRLDLVVANPQVRDVDLVVWSCVPDRGTCTEFFEGIDPVVIPDGSPHDDVRLPTPPLDPNLLALVGSLRLPVFVLACEVGACPFVERLKAGDVLGVVAQLPDPGSILAEAPEAGVHLAVHTVEVSLLNVDRNTNPVLVPRVGGDRDPCVPPDVVAPAARAWLCLESVDAQGGPLVAYAYSSAGAMVPSAARVRDRRVDFEYVAPPRSAIDEDLTVDLWVVAEEDDGAGSAVFHHVIQVPVEAR